MPSPGSCNLHSTINYVIARRRRMRRRGCAEVSEERALRMRHTPCGCNLLWQNASNSPKTNAKMQQFCEIATAASGLAMTYTVVPAHGRRKVAPTVGNGSACTGRWGQRALQCGVYVHGCTRRCAPTDRYEQSAKFRFFAPLRTGYRFTMLPPFLRGDKGGLLFQIC